MIMEIILTMIGIAFLVALAIIVRDGLRNG